MGEKSLGVPQIGDAFNQEEGVFHVNDVDSVSVAEHVLSSVTCEIVGLGNLYEF